MWPLKTARWSGLVMVVAVLAGAGISTTATADQGPRSAVDDGGTLWTTVKSDALGLVAFGTTTVRSLGIWLSSLSGGNSRLASDLLTFTGKDLRELEVLVDQAGYQLEDITIRLGDPDHPGDVTLNFTYRHPIDNRHQADLQSLVVGHNAAVDSDTGTIIAALLDAATRATATSSDRFPFHRVQVRLGQPPTVTLDFLAPNDRSANRSPVPTGSDGFPPEPNAAPVNAPSVPPPDRTAQTEPVQPGAPIPQPILAPKGPAEPIAKTGSATAATPAVVQPPPANAATPETGATESFAITSATSQAYRIIGTRVNGHAGPGLHEPVVRELTPTDRLYRTGNHHRNWIEVTLDGGPGTPARLWVYDGVVTPVP